MAKKKTETGTGISNKQNIVEMAEETTKTVMSEQGELNIKEKIDNIEETKNNIKKEIEVFIDNLNSEFFKFGNKELLNSARKFLSEGARWKYSEAMYIRGAIEEIDNILKHQNSQDEKDFIFSVPNRILDTLNFFLSKVEGTGYDVDYWFFSLQDTSEEPQNLDLKEIFDGFLELLEKTQDSLKLVEPWRRKLKFYEQKLEACNHMIHSWQMGIDPGNILDDLEESFKEDEAKYNAKNS